MKLYGLKNCDACRRALKSLSEHGIEVEFVDLRTDGVSKSILPRFHAAFGDELLNRRSTTWRNLGVDRRSDDLLTLMAAHPLLMKRPLIDRAGQLHLGWRREVRSVLLS